MTQQNDTSKCNGWNYIRAGVTSACKQRHSCERYTSEHGDKSTIITPPEIKFGVCELKIEVKPCKTT